MSDRLDNEPRGDAELSEPQAAEGAAALDDQPLGRVTHNGKPLRDFPEEARQKILADAVSRFDTSEKVRAGLLRATGLGGVADKATAIAGKAIQEPLDRASRRVSDATFRQNQGEALVKALQDTPLHRGPRADQIDALAKIGHTQTGHLKTLVEGTEIARKDAAAAKTIGGWALVISIIAVLSSIVMWLFNLSLGR